MPALYEFAEPDYGFKVGVPEGWQKIVAADDESTSGSLEPGFAVGFESPRDDEHDQFADYILIEVLPGTDSGLFEADTSDSQIIIIDGEPARYDRILIDNSSSDITPVDLMIHQAELRGLGYTIGLYAIGEPENDAIMSSAFEAMIRTFIRTATPFNVI